MSRHKKRPAVATRSPETEAAKRTPIPPRPRRWFLLTTIGLLIAWLGFLAAMAVGS